MQFWLIIPTNSYGDLRNVQGQIRLMFWLNTILEVQGEYVHNGPQPNCDSVIWETFPNHVSYESVIIWCIASLHFRSLITKIFICVGQWTVCISITLYFQSPEHRKSVYNMYCLYPLRASWISCKFVRIFYPLYFMNISVFRVLIFCVRDSLRCWLLQYQSRRGSLWRKYPV